MDSSDVLIVLPSILMFGYVFFAEFTIQNSDHQLMVLPQSPSLLQIFVFAVKKSTVLESNCGCFEHLAEFNSRRHSM